MSAFENPFRSGSSPTGDARQWVADGALLLDVRTPTEFAEGHLPGAVNIPVQDLQQRMTEIQAGRRVVVYCRSGARSAVAGKLLRAGDHEVLDLGTMSGW